MGSLAAKMLKIGTLPINCNLAYIRTCIPVIPGAKTLLLSLAVQYLITVSLSQLLLLHLLAPRSDTNDLKETNIQNMKNVIVIHILYAPIDT
jgi:hypothetical protein